MIRFWSLLLTFVLCRYDDQVVKVLDVTDMTVYPLTVGNDPATTKYYAISSFVVTPQGFVSTNTVASLQSWKTYKIPDDSEFHYMVTASYQSSGLSNGPSGNPYQGALRFGLAQTVYFGIGFNWVITDAKAWVYIIIARDESTMHWMIPVADISPDETVVYEIVMSKKNACVSFSIDRQERFRYCGDQGIDPKFLVYSIPSAPPSGREPKLTSADFETEFMNLIYLGRIIVENRASLPACLDATFHMCADTTYRAFHTRCVYGPIPPPFPEQLFSAQLDQIQIFHVNRTGRCPGYSDTSTCQIGYLGRCDRYYDI